MQLAATEYGSGPPLVLLHGLFGSGRNWAAIARRLGAIRRVVALDARNHGHSPWAADMDYPAMAADTFDTMAARGLGRAVLLGHSMGGKTAMMAALLRPSAVGALIVADIAPVAYGHSQMPLIEAMKALDLSRIARRADADAALEPAAPEAALRGFLLQNLVFEDRPPRWRINLDALAADMTALLRFDLPPAATPYGGPTLFVHGGRSDYLRPEHHAAIRRLFPASRIEKIDGAGHWLHAEKPDRFVATVEEFLRDLPA